MKYPCIAILIVLVSVSSVNAAKKNKHLFILSGQSNMARFDPNISFTPTVEKEFGKENVTVVKNAMSGQPIRLWHKDYKYPAGTTVTADKKSIGSLYKGLMKNVTKVTAGKTYDSVTFVWMQGERDAKESLGEVYAQSFTGILAQLKDDLKLKSINFVIGRISDFDMSDKTYPHWTMIRKAQVTVAEADPKGAWVDTDDLNNRKPGQKGGGLHYTKDGYNTLGLRFAEKAIELIKNNAQ